MGNLRTIVKNGRLILDEPTYLPEGLVLDLIVDDEGDDLDEGSRHALHQSILDGLRQTEEGAGRLASDAIDDLRRRRGLRSLVFFSPRAETQLNRVNFRGAPRLPESQWTRLVSHPRSNLGLRAVDRHGEGPHGM
jgi:hypothetical protein